MLEGSPPQQPEAELDIEPIPAESEMAYITELDGNSTYRVADTQQVKIKWKYINGRWIPEEMGRPEPVNAPAIAPTPPPAVLQEIVPELIPSTLPADVIASEPVIPPAPVFKPELVVAPFVPPEPVERQVPRDTRKDMRIDPKQVTPVNSTPQDPFGWAELDKSSLTRIIAINYEMLAQGNDRMNIVVQDGDKIMVPSPKIGVYYVQGEISRPGAYGLTGRQVTIKQALTEAGNMGPLAWPQNAMLIRRIGERQEQMIPIDIEAIFKGEENDIFLKADDMICIGTDVRAIFYAVLRNAFRMTYGFGFIYDRNFSQPLSTTPKSNRFTRL